MNKNELIAKIRGLDGLDTEEKSALIGLLNEHKKYGLVWEEKPEDCEKNLVNELPVLCEVPERFVGASAPASAPNHILIEGDNYHALTALQYTHAGKVDVIYIDPPYNTGNKDFVYNDRFVDKEDSYRHSKWLSFMSKRLRLAKTLLKETGVIFISIDDNEQAQLKLLCDEVFGNSNSIGEFIWQCRSGASDAIKNFSSDHEYIIVYGKTEFASLSGVKRTFARYSNPDNDPRGEWIADNLSAGKPGGDTYYAVINPETGAEYWPPKGRYWPYSPSTMRKKIEEGRIIFPVKIDGSPLLKRFKNEAKSDSLPVSSCLSSENIPENKRKNNTLYVSHTTAGTKELQDIFGDKAFPHPKPTILLTSLLTQTVDTSIILDFFAGSGTSLHATMALNAEDGGNRQCILVTNNEIKDEVQKQMLADGIVKGSSEWEAKGICQAVTYERNKRVIEGYTNAKGEAVSGLGNNKLRYFKVGFVPAEPTLANLKALVKASVGLLCVKEDAYEAVQIPAAYDTGSLRAFRARDGLLLLIEDEDSILNAIEWIADSNERFKVYVFSANHYAHDAEFEEELSPEGLARVELCALPDAILRAYQSVIRAARSRSQGSIDDEGSESEVQTEEVEA